jgi:hypothetical protein
VLRHAFTVLDADRGKQPLPAGEAERLLQFLYRDWGRPVPQLRANP